MQCVILKNASGCCKALANPPKAAAGRSSKPHKHFFAPAAIQDQWPRLEGVGDKPWTCSLAKSLGRPENTCVRPAPARPFPRAGRLKDNLAAPSVHALCSTCAA